MVKLGYRKESPKDILFYAVLYTFLGIVCLLVIMPLCMVLYKSLANFRVDEQGNKHYFIDLVAYVAVFTTSNLLSSFLLEILVVCISTAMAVVVNAMLAYTLVSPGFSTGTKRILTTFIFVTMIFGAGTVPYYITIRNLHLKDNLLVYILPFLANGFNTLIIRNFFYDLPQGVVESARMDGASDFTILFKICFPLSKPTIVTVGLWFAVAKWNDWYTGTVFITNPKLYVIQNVLRAMLVENFEGRFDPMMLLEDNRVLLMENVQMAAVVISILPLLIVYPFVQKYFIKGIFVGSVKE